MEIFTIYAAPWVLVAGGGFLAWRNNAAMHKSRREPPSTDNLNTTDRTLGITKSFDASSLVSLNTGSVLPRAERTSNGEINFHDALESISEAFVVWDSENRLVVCNSKFQQIYDLPGEAIIVGAPYAQVMESGTAPLFKSQVVLGEALPFGARTFEAQLADGRWLQINERRTKDGGYVSVGTDVTALKRNEEQLILSETELRASMAELHRSHQTLENQKQKLIQLAEQYLEQKTEAEKANRAKSDFLVAMQHELFTPLNAILGFSEIMMLEAFGTLGAPLYVDYSKDIHESGRRLRDIISDILDKARLEAGRGRSAEASELRQRVFTDEKVVLLDQVKRQIDGFDRKREEVDRAIGKLQASLSNKN